MYLSESSSFPPRALTSTHVCVLIKVYRINPSAQHLHLKGGLGSCTVPPSPPHVLFTLFNLLDISRRRRRRHSSHDVARLWRALAPFLLDFVTLSSHPPAPARPSRRRVVWPFRFPSGLFGRSRGGGQFFSFTKKSDAVSAEEELSGQWPPHRLVVVHKGNERPLLSSLLFLAQTLHFLLEPCGMLQWPQGARRRESHRWQRRVAGLRARRIQH